MPTYEYQCSCGLKFDGNAKLADRAKPKKCPSCNTDAPPVVPSTVQGHFNHQVTGPVPQNTGIHDLDTHIDRVIGQSARQGHEVIRERVKDKKELLAGTPEATGYDLSRNPDGTYRVMTPDERGIHERSQNIHKTAMGLISQTWQRGPRRSR
jgi:putative FmdB family regulatory protein